MGRTLGVQFHPEIDPEVLEAWLAMDGGCAEVEAEGINVDQLRAQTIDEKIGADKRALELVDTFLRRVATADVEKVD
jgi:GMP synthase-like glutamine amidotransferase